MKELNLKLQDWLGRPVLQDWKATELFWIGLLLLMVVRVFAFPQGNPMDGWIDPVIWPLILLSLVCFLGLVGLCWLLMRWFWGMMGLPGFGSMVLQFKSMELWMQLGFYWASFALLVLAAVGCLSAIC